MARVTLGMEPLDDAVSFPRQKAKALYARRFAEMNLWLFAHRGRTLANQSFTREWNIKLFDSPSVVGYHHIHRTQTNRPMVLAVTTLATYSPEDVPLDGLVTFDTHAGGSSQEISLPAQQPSTPANWQGKSHDQIAEFARVPVSLDRFGGILSGRQFALTPAYAPRVNLWLLEPSVANVELQVTIALSGKCNLRRYHLFEAPLRLVS